MSIRRAGACSRRIPSEDFLLEIVIRSGRSMIAPTVVWSFSMPRPTPNGVILERKRRISGEFVCFFGGRSIIAPTVVWSFSYASPDPEWGHPRAQAKDLGRIGMFFRRAIDDRPYSGMVVFPCLARPRRGHPRA